mmetsp:Transcript_74107/g.234048  ORF Transcript_74107/g.234048 Transcript_74107/m.234048 type:complete len:338 (-) Transcript_74107:865-1878(-)
MPSCKHREVQGHGRSCSSGCDRPAVTLPEFPRHALWRQNKTTKSAWTPAGGQPTIQCVQSSSQGAISGRARAKGTQEAGLLRCSTHQKSAAHGRFSPLLESRLGGTSLWESLRDWKSWGPQSIAGPSRLGRKDMPTIPPQSSFSGCSGSRGLRSTPSSSAFAALRTAACHIRAPSAVVGRPVSRSIRLARYSVHLDSPESRSRMTMSWMPSLFSVSVESEAADELRARPLRPPDACSIRKASPVLSSARAQQDEGRNLALSTANMPRQALPKPAYVKSSWPASSWPLWRAANPESPANSCATDQNFRAWNAASAVLNGRLAPGSQGVSRSISSASRS